MARETDRTGRVLRYGLLLAVLLLQACGETGSDHAAHQGHSADDAAPADGEFVTSESGLAVGNAYVRQPAPGQSAVAAFVTFRNHSKQAFTLNHVESPRAAAVEVHRTLYENGVMAMRQVNHLVVPPEGELVFEPGGHHLMLSGVEGTLEPGDKLPLEFSFEGGTQLQIEVPVRRLH